MKLLDKCLLHQIGKALDAFGKLWRVQVLNLHHPARGTASELPNGSNGQFTCQPAEAGAAHAIGDRHAIGLISRQTELAGGDVREKQLLRARSPQNDVMVLVFAATQARVRGRAEFEVRVGYRMDKVFR